MSQYEQWVTALDDFDPQVRREALAALAAGAYPLAPPTENHNLHFHSFFSYNAEGWSPSHVAWAAHEAGLYAAGLCDFDVLDGLEEFLQAGELLGLRATVNLETRAYFPEYAAVDISSPGEPGVTYIMGGGFVRLPEPGSAQAAGLEKLRQEAQARNMALVERINPHVPDIALDYAADVLPLTPAGGATERHIISAYCQKAAAVKGSPEATAGFWSEILGKPAAELLAVLDSPALEEMVRSKLAKKGGFGYVQPSADTFPPVAEFIGLVRSCDAIPMVTWLDGTSGGEAEGRAMLECLQAQGAAAVNIIPDRNWNVKDPADRATKVANLQALVTAANDLGLPLNIGTEMNKSGLPFVDDLAGPVLGELRESFLQGARIMVGHSVLARYAGLSYLTCDLPVAARNDYFAAVGALPPLKAAVARQLAENGPAGALAAIEQAVARGRWE